MYRLGKLSDYTLPYFWLLPALISFCSGMVSRILGGSAGTLTTFALYGLLILGITDGYNKRFLGLARFDLFLIFFVAISIIGTYALFPQNGIYLTRSLSNWPFALLFFIVGKSLVNINMDHVHYASAIGILLMFFGYFVFKSQTNKDMSFAYSALPYVVGLCHGFFFSKKLWLKAFMPIGIALLFLLGTRGPLVIGAAYFIFCFLAKKNTIRRFILCLGGFALLISFINSDQYMLFLNQANDYLMNYGIESYILRNAILGSTASVDSRIEFSTQIWNLLQDDILSMHGLCGDRVVLSGSYAHNFVAEFLYAYGVTGGCFILGVILIGLASIYSKLKTRDDKNFMMMVIFAFGAKLMFSGSFISDIWLYFVVGIISRLNYSPSGSQQYLTLL